MKSLASVSCRLLVVSGLLALQTCALAKPIAFDSPNEIAGRVVGPVISGQVEDETQVKAYHLKMDRPLLLNDPKSTCGRQRIKSLPILSQGMGRYKNKKVRIFASIQCVESRLGSYAIDRAHSIKVVK